VSVAEGGSEHVKEQACEACSGPGADAWRGASSAAVTGTHLKRRSQGTLSVHAVLTSDRDQGAVHPLWLTGPQSHTPLLSTPTPPCICPLLGGSRLQCQSSPLSLCLRSQGSSRTSPTTTTWGRWAGVCQAHVCAIGIPPAHSPTPKGPPAAAAKQDELTCRSAHQGLSCTTSTTSIEKMSAQVWGE